MRVFVYIMQDCKSGLHTGFTKDITKVVAFYNSIVSLLPPPEKLNRLVYMEEYTTESAAATRFNEIYKMSREKKAELIEAVNPDYVEFIIGENITL